MEEVVVRKLSSWLCVLAVTIFGVLSSFGRCFSAYADERPEYRLQVSPATLSLDLEPGRVTTAEFRVQNTGSKTFEFEVDISPYSVVDEEYTADYESSSAYTDLAKWVTFSQDRGEVQPGGSIPVTVTIAVPKDVPAGGQYASVMISMVNDGVDGDGMAISMIKRVGLVMYSTVEGKTRKEGKVIENKVPSFKFQSPVTASSVVENTGNVHATATYTLQVFPLFGGEEVYSNEDKPDTRTILPETKRYNEIQWEGAPALGIFKVKQTVNFLGQDSVTEKIVFLCPIWFLFIILLLIFVIIFWIINRVRGRRAF